MDYEEKTKLDMYQLEWQFNSERNPDKEQVSPAKERRDNVRPVSVFDYNEYRKLEDKRDRIVLKKDLYERKKENDFQKNGILSKEISEATGVKKSLAD